jgi:hypothetical protein
MIESTIKWDLLHPEDIEVKVVQAKDGTITALLYQNSRCTVRALDKMFGSFGWQIDYKMVGDQIYGTLSIKDGESGEWVSKSDTGDKSNISEDKGQSSDILKRCAARWGFATELYTAPKIKFKDSDAYYFNNKMTMTFSVKSIDYVGRQISQLSIADRFDKVVFDWTINQMSAPVYNDGSTKHYMASKGHIEAKACDTMSNEDRLIAFRDAMRGKCDDKTLNDFFNFYMRVDNKQNNGRSVAANWDVTFNPEERYRFWLNKKNNTNKYGYNG